LAEEAALQLVAKEKAKFKAAIEAAEASSKDRRIRITEKAKCRNDSSKGI
jgi:hypothetical protein